ncbi:ABC transporter permease [Sediminitomix flava]|uniref:Peptide/nickel transport system permease protein n=1 Tax=Sediminitomix flava TaxID=379075 RepID=A0A315ZEX1_SEDFL|nr:ABC transporter permease [Sediminitomix flava]PWJ44105.1 peptide/nickel transport system permease protein [Sediminitomix flava]
MIRFLAKRFVHSFFVLIGIVLVVFSLFQLLPGDPVSMMAGYSTTMSEREEMRKELGLDKPVSVQLVNYLNDLSFISVYEDTPQNEYKYDYQKLFSVNDSQVVLKKPYLGKSFQTNKRVIDVLLEYLPGTILLSLAAMLISTFLGVIFGVLSALNKDSFWDHFFVALSTFGISIPTFVSAIIISITFGYYFGDFTGLSMTGSLYETLPSGKKVMKLQNIILPAITLGIRPLSIITQMTRSSLLEVLNQDYIRTARAKGLGFIKVVFVHALRNALNPVLTTVTGWLASLMAGAFFIEYIFKWKGIGYKTIQAVENMDLPIVMGATIMVGTIFILVNIFVDILYAFLDPRVRIDE